MLKGAASLVRSLGRLIVAPFRRLFGRPAAPASSLLPMAIAARAPALAGDAPQKLAQPTLAVTPQPGPPDPPDPISPELQAAMGPLPDCVTPAAAAAICLDQIAQFGRPSWRYYSRASLSDLLKAEAATADSASGLKTMPRPPSRAMQLGAI